MAPTVAVYRTSNKRSRIICDAMTAGLMRHGVAFIDKHEAHYTGVEADVAIFYGLEGNLSKVFKDYSRKSKACYVDLGYWGRREGGRWSGYHKVSVNSRHPTEYFQKSSHDDTRFSKFGLRIEDWKQTKYWKQDGKHVVVAGMGDKGAAAEGYGIHEWEEWAIGKIKEVSKRPVTYRPKPSWKQARPISGTTYSYEKSPAEREKALDRLFVNCHAVVTHHSNVAVEALIKGIPVFVWKGVAVGMGSQDLSLIDEPLKPDGRVQWANDIAYTQWNVEEMAHGDVWNHLTQERLLCE